VRCGRRDSRVLAVHGWYFFEYTSVLFFLLLEPARAGSSGFLITCDAVRKATTAMQKRRQEEDADAETRRPCEARVQPRTAAGAVKCACHAHNGSSPLHALEARVQPRTAAGAVKCACHAHNGSSPLHALEAASSFFPAARARRHPRGRPRLLVPLAPSRKQPCPAATAAIEASAWESGPTRAAATARAAEAAAGRTKEAGHRPGGECPGRRYVRRDRRRPVAAQVRHRDRPQSLVDPRQVRYSRV